MKKMMLLMLSLLMWSVASMDAQVRIGGTVDPDPSAVLDLNKTNATGAQTGNLGLSLPRVSLTATDMYLVADQVPKNGTIVYNTNTSASLSGAGVYCWITNKWVKVVVAPVQTADIADGAVTAPKLARMGATDAQFLMWDGTAWSPANVGIKSMPGILATVPAGSRSYVMNKPAGDHAKMVVRNCEQDSGTPQQTYWSSLSSVVFYFAQPTPKDIVVNCVFIEFW